MYFFEIIKENRKFVKDQYIQIIIQSVILFCKVSLNILLKFVKNNIDIYLNRKVVFKKIGLDIIYYIINSKCFNKIWCINDL